MEGSFGLAEFHRSECLCFTMLSGFCNAEDKHEVNRVAFSNYSLYLLHFVPEAFSRL